MTVSYYVLLGYDFHNVTDEQIEAIKSVKLHVLREIDCPTSLFAGVMMASSPEFDDFENFNNESMVNFYSEEFFRKLDATGLPEPDEVRLAKFRVCTE